MNFGRVLLSNTAHDCRKVFYRHFNKRTQKFDYNKLIKVNKQANKKPRLSVILKEDVPNLGAAGQIVQVKRGYGRNYLILNQLAVYATHENKEKYVARTTNQEGKSLVADPKILPFFENAVLKIAVRDGGEPWQITSDDISEECRKKLNVVVPRHCVEMLQPITCCGEHLIGIVINEKVRTQLKCSVEPI